MTSVIGLIRDAILANVRDDIIWKHFVEVRLECKQTRSFLSRVLNWNGWWCRVAEGLLGGLFPREARMSPVFL